MMPTPKQTMLTRKWRHIHTTKTQMEKLLLALMENPETDAEHLMQAHAMYAKVCREIADVSHHVTNALRNPSYVMSSHMTSCPAHKTGNEELCECKDWSNE